MTATYISLNRSIDTNKFLHTVQQLLQQHGDVKDCILKLEILKISRDDHAMIPKLEFKPLTEN